MKKNTSCSANPSRREFNHRLDGYSALSVPVVASVTILGASVPTATAQIHNITSFTYDGGVSFSGAPDVSMPGSGARSVSFNTANGARFGLKVNHATSVGFGEVGENGNHQPLALAVGGYVKRFVAGALLTARNVSAGTTHFLAARSSGGKNGGPFLPGVSQVKTGYVAFKNIAAGHTYYGWLRVKVTNDANGYPDEIALIQSGTSGVYGAYGLISSGITAGEVSSIPEPTTVASGLGLLALGAAGVREMRRRRKPVASATD